MIRILFTLAFLLVFAPAPRAEAVTVFAAASLADALAEVAAGFEASGGAPVTLSFAGSSVLARQIEQGAPADLFISANPRWMDHLAGRGLIEADSRVNLLSNTLVLIGHGASAPAELTADFDLAGRLGEGRLALALSQSVPAGLYAREALTRLGLWEAVADRRVEADNVRAALRLVARGEAPMGIVYATDARAEPAVSVIATFPAERHAPILYPAALMAGRDGPAARAFLAFLTGPAAAAVFTAHGFTVPAR